MCDLGQPCESPGTGANFRENLPFDFRPQILSPCAKIHIIYRSLVPWNRFIKYISKQTLQSKLPDYGWDISLPATTLMSNNTLPLMYHLTHSLT